MRHPEDWPIVQRYGKQHYLFASILLFMLAGPLLGPTPGPGERLGMFLVLTFVFITGPLTASRTRFELTSGAILATAMFLSGMTSSLVGRGEPVTLLSGVVFFAYLTFLVARDLLTSTTQVNTKTLWTAVNVYVLSGLFFAFLYATIAYFDHTAFNGKLMDMPLRDQIYGFVYLSFVTLTTLGYGDITPNNLTVATLTYMEALFGQLFLAIMVARLVGLYKGPMNR